MDLRAPTRPTRGYGKIHRVGSDFGSTLTVSNRDSQSNCLVNGKIMGQPCEFQAVDLRGVDRRHDRVATFKLHMLGIFLVARYDRVIAGKGLACE